jgi:hypothetical protein
MNKKLVVPFIVFLSILVIDITTLISGIRNHEVWRISVSSISLALVLLVAIIVIIKTNREKRKEVL